MPNNVSMMKMAAVGVTCAIIGAVGGAFVAASVLSPVKEARAAISEVVDLADVHADIVAREVGRVGRGMAALADKAPEIEVEPVSGGDAVASVVGGFVSVFGQAGERRQKASEECTEAGGTPELVKGLVVCHDP